MLGELVSAGANLLGGWLSGERQDKNTEKQLQAQREFAQNGIQWKVNDAKAAGISPYYALGASTASYSPVSVGEGGIGKGLSDASQDVGRAAAATMSKEDRDDVAKKAATLDLTNKDLQNELLKTQIAKMRGQIGPAMPTLKKSGDAGGNLIDGQPATQTTTVSGAPVKNDDIKQQAETIPKHNRIRPFGFKLHTNPYFSDAEDIETRYGDTAEEVGGLANLAGDAYWTGKHYWTRYAPWVYKKMRDTYRSSHRPSRFYRSGN